MVLQHLSGSVQRTKNLSEEFERTSFSKYKGGNSGNYSVIHCDIIGFTLLFSPENMGNFKFYLIKIKIFQNLLIHV